MIESEPALSRLLPDVLERMGFDVTLETRGDRAIDATDRGPFDVVVVDRETPGIDGFDLVTYVHHRFPETPIVFVTAVGGALVAQTARDRGATRYLEKPIRVEELVRAITDTVDGARTRTRARPPDDAALPRAGARRRLAASAGAGGHRNAGRLWAVVLAGGQGMRLRPLVRRVHGEPRPK